MDRLLSMTVFRRVAELESFSAAARDLGLSNAAVSKHVAALEEHLRTRLLHRTTRRVAPTPAGAAYLERCARILDDLAEAEEQVMQSTAAPKGTLRVNVPAAFGLLHVSPLVPSLLAKWPELTLDLSLTDRFVDLVEEGVDVVLRIASELPDSSTLVAQRLARTRSLVCGAPRYFRKRGVPRVAADLAAHNCIGYGLVAPEWRFEGPDGPARVAVKGNLRADNSLLIRDALVAGAGVGLMPAFYVDSLLRDGKLRQVLTDHVAPPVFIHAVYPRQRHLSTKVRVFVEHVRAAVAGAPWADPSTDPFERPTGPATSRAQRR